MEDGLRPFKGKNLKAGASVSGTGGLEDRTPPPAGLGVKG